LTLVKPKRTPPFKGVAKIINKQMGTMHKISHMRLMAFAAVFLLFNSQAIIGAQAVTIDFDGLTVGSDISGVDLGGVVISSGSDAVIVTSSNPAGTGNSIRTEPFTSIDPFRADFITTGVSSVSVALGDFGGDSENLFLDAFDSADNLLDTANFSIATSVSNLILLSIASGTEISYVLFGANGFFSNSVYADDLNFSVSVVPLPAAFTLFASGLGFLGLMGWRKRRKSLAA